MNSAVSPYPEVTLTEAQLRSLDVPGPRYTSYPTADRFVEAFGPNEYRQALRQRAQAEFSWPASAERIANLYDLLTKGVD